MLGRLILALLLACLALPAAATPACHQAIPVAAMSAHHSMPKHEAPRDDAAVAHACIGCIPPSSWDGGAIAAWSFNEAAFRRGPALALALGMPAAPDTPPPRG